jgi:hypothetical protein
MQRRNREITIFSLSAIDLFCSGMGAIMVLMVLLMPYYKKTTPTNPSPAVEVKTPQKSSAIQVEDIDLVFVMDATMSMQDELEAVRDGLRSIVQVLRRVSDDARVGFVTYIDREVLTSSPLLPVNRGAQGDGNMERLQKVVDGVELVGNSDWPEDVYEGLQKAVSLSWGAEASNRRQMIVVIGDASTHPEHVDASFALARRWVGSSSRRSISVVNTGSALDLVVNPDSAPTTPYFKQLTKDGKGSYLEKQSDLIGSILDLIIVR